MLREYCIVAINNLAHEYTVSSKEMRSLQLKAMPILSMAMICAVSSQKRQLTSENLE